MFYKQKVEVGNSLLYQGDCLDVMPMIADGSVDMIFCDLPFGTTQNKWDIIIDMDKLWYEYKRIIKDNGAIVLCAAQPFTSKLITAGIDLYREEWIWEKPQGTNYLNAKRGPLRSHESILIFAKKTPIFNPIRKEGYKPYVSNPTKKYTESYGQVNPIKIVNIDGTRHPTTIVKFNPDRPQYHPNQKPVKLCEYFINSYSNKGDLILDNTMGGGSAGVACELNERRFLGIEKGEYFNVAVERIRKATEQDLKKVG